MVHLPLETVYDILVKVSASNYLCSPPAVAHQQAQDLPCWRAVFFVCWYCNQTSIAFAPLSVDLTVRHLFYEVESHQKKVTDYARVIRCRIKSKDLPTISWNVVTLGGFLRVPNWMLTEQCMDELVCCWSLSLAVRIYAENADVRRRNSFSTSPLLIVLFDLPLCLRTEHSSCQVL